MSTSSNTLIVKKFFIIILVLYFSEPKTLVVITSNLTDEVGSIVVKAYLGFVLKEKLNLSRTFIENCLRRLIESNKVKAVIS